MEKNQSIQDKTASFGRSSDGPYIGGETPNSSKLEPNTEVDVKSAETEGEKSEDKEEVEKKEETESTVPTDPNSSVEKVYEDIDQFLLSTPIPGVEDDVNFAVQVPRFVEKFLDLVETKISKYDSGEGKAKLFRVPEEDSSLLDAINRLSKLNDSLHSFNLEENQSWLINHIGSIQQRAMSYLEDELRMLLEESRTSDSDQVGDTKSDTKGKQEVDRCVLPESDSSAPNQVDFPGYSDELISNLNKIAKEMISGGYESECCQIYIFSRRNILDESLQMLGFEKHSIDDVQKMHWEALEREIATWIKTFRQCVAVYFPGERKLAEASFSDYPSISASLFGNLTRGVVIQLLNFAEGIAMTKRSPEKLFKLLDMYEALRDMAPKMDGLFPDECANELNTETTTARCRLGEAAICIFCDLENSVKADTAKTPVPGGAVHPLTRYTMNYLKYACEYKDTLEQIFKEHSRFERSDSTSRPSFHGEEAIYHTNNDNETQSPFSLQLMRVMDLLDCNLETKSKLYKDVALSSIFMMNNGRYILQKIKGSAEINELMGDTWYRKKSSDLRQYHKNYQRETWTRLLGCLSHEGLSVNGKVAKPVLKERFKSFNAMFEEIHKTQSTWVVSDEQLLLEIRVSISAVMIPAYRSFLGRFSQYLDPGRQTEKYVKFQPEDIETYIDELFDGNPPSTARRRP